MKIIAEYEQDHFQDTIVAGFDMSNLYLRRVFVAPLVGKQVVWLRLDRIVIESVNDTAGLEASFTRISQKDE